MGNREGYKRPLRFHVLILQKQSIQTSTSIQHNTAYIHYHFPFSINNHCNHNLFKSTFSAKHSNPEPFSFHPNHSNSHTTNHVFQQTRHHPPLSHSRHPRPPTNLITRQAVTEDILNAQANWFIDTSLVSQFLSSAPFLSGSALSTAATSALASENNELVHKGVIDAAFRNIINLDPNVLIANATLVDNTRFQFVVDGLTDLSLHGAGYTPDQVLFSVNEINGVRCGQVLPAIDVYLSNAGVLSGVGDSQRGGET